VPAFAGNDHANLLMRPAIRTSHFPGHFPLGPFFPHSKFARVGLAKLPGNRLKN
jgi:hypothetical protein